MCVCVSFSLAWRDDNHRRKKQRRKWNNKHKRRTRIAALSRCLRLLLLVGDAPQEYIQHLRSFLWWSYIDKIDILWAFFFVYLFIYLLLHTGSAERRYIEVMQCWHFYIQQCSDAHIRTWCTTIDGITAQTHLCYSSSHDSLVFYILLLSSIII